MKPIQVKTTQGQRYRILREVNCLSQQEVNEHMGRASSWCSQLEKDCFELTVDAALKIARMYKVTLDQLIGEEAIEVLLMPKVNGF
jgi:transcriptional regulator with XRE-family HTH domain